MPERFNAKDALADYVTVPQRIAQFYELFGTGRLVTGEVRVEMGPDGKPRVIVQGLAYRTPEDPLPGVGWSWMELPGTTAFTRGSELENTETSAWGRAIAALGILVDRSVASANEVRAKSGEDGPGKPDPVRAAIRADEPELIGPWSGTGAIGVTKKVADGLLRQSPEGGLVIVTFTTTDEERIPQAIFRGALAADVIDAAGSMLNGLVGTLEGDLYSVPYFVGQEKIPRPFRRLEVKRIVTAGWTLPLEEAPTVPLFPGMDDTLAEWDAELAK